MQPLDPFSPTPGPRGQDVDRVEAALSWLWLLSVVFLVLGWHRPFVRFHARQGVVLFVLSMAAWVVAPLAPVGGWRLQGLLQFVVFLTVVIGFLQALRGRWWELPFLARLASRAGL